MATTQTVNSNYEGAYAGALLVEAFKLADTINKNAITVIPNVIGEGNLPGLQLTGEWAARACGWDPQGEVEYTEKSIPTKQYQLQIELCKNDYRSTFLAQQMNLFGNSEDIPANLEAAILDGLVKHFGQTLDSNIWNLETDTNNFSGLIEQFDADTDIEDITATTASITADNVIDELQKMYDALPGELEDHPDLVWVVSADIAKAYKLAQAKQISIGNIVGDKELDYLGHKLIRIDGLPSKTMVAYRRTNLGLLTGVENELNEVRLIDTDATTGDGNVRILMRWNLGVGYTFSHEIFYYS